MLSRAACHAILRRQWSFKLLLSARKKWRRIDGSNNLAEVINGVMFKDGIKQIQHAA